ncbi:type II toxin-antitoxin system RelE/ParE family toxin [Blastomonas sp.]|uniref:type II toxin-antitoxin system RelE/ParE family toxin n=1 Tax=Blastomonas sp. TaxID=1909299 RepID=UPI003919A6F3
MNAVASTPARVFKTAWFAKAARKARISDDELCDAIAQVMKGQADDLGGGVFKKRLNKNQHRAIIVAKAGRHWMYEYLFAKKDRANIEDHELAAFRKLAKIYETLTDAQIVRLLADGDIMEICNDDQN